MHVSRNYPYWADISTSKIQRADLDGGNIEDLITTGVPYPASIALDLSDIPPPVSIDIVADPNPAQIGNPLEILLDLNNPGNGFDANFGLWVLVNNNVTMLVNLSPFVPLDFTLIDFPIFSTPSVPAGLPPAVVFLAAIFNAASGEVLGFDTEFVGIDVAPSSADITALRQAATDFLRMGGQTSHILNSGAINAAPGHQEPAISFNGTVNNPFGQQVNSKGKLTTTWGRLKVAQ